MRTRRPPEAVGRAEPVAGVRPPLSGGHPAPSRRASRRRASGRRSSGAGRRSSATASGTSPTRSARSAGRPGSASSTACHGLGRRMHEDRGARRGPGCPPRGPAGPRSAPEPWHGPAVEPMLPTGAGPGTGPGRPLHRCRRPDPAHHHRRLRGGPHGTHGTHGHTVAITESGPRVLTRREGPAVGPVVTFPSPVRPAGGKVTTGRRRIPPRRECLERRRTPQDMPPQKERVIVV